MPVTAKLSKRFYDALGEDVVNEMVEWFNTVDATYRADLTELVETQAQRFDARLEQRLSEVKADLRGELASLRTEQRAGIAELKSEIANRHSELIKWVFLFWLGTAGITLVGLLR